MLPNNRKKYVEYCFIILLCIVPLVLSCAEKTYLLWDAHDYFEVFETYEKLTFPKFGVCGHISYSFALGGFILTKVFGSALIAQIVYGKIFLVIAIIGFWKLIDFIFKKESVYLKVFAVAIYAFSPYIIGLSAYSYLDCAIWCVLPLLTYELYTKKNSVFCFLVATFFVFIKETAVITYFSIVFGMYLVDCFESKKIFQNIYRYLFYAIPCILWLFAYVFIGHWEGGSLSFDLQYVWNKTKSFFFLNFNWLLFLAAAVSFVLMIRKGNVYQKYLKLFFPTLFSVIFFYLFSISFTTVIHPRYIDGAISQLYLLACFLPFLIRSWKKILAIAIGLSCSVSSCFFTIDPIMLLGFENINVGTANMITTQETLCDSMVYNCQHQSFGFVMDEALRNIYNDPDNIVYFPAGDNNCSWYFDSMGHYILLYDSECVIKEPWDTKNNTRMTSINNPDNVWFDVHIIRDDHMFHLESNQTGYYFYLDFFGSEKANEIRNTKKVINEREYEHNGWILKTVQFKEEVNNTSETDFPNSGKVD